LSALSPVRASHGFRRQASGQVAGLLLRRIFSPRQRGRLFGAAAVAFHEPLAADPCHWRGALGLDPVAVCRPLPAVTAIPALLGEPGEPAPFGAAGDCCALQQRLLRVGLSHASSTIATHVATPPYQTAC